MRRYENPMTIRILGNSKCRSSRILIERTRKALQEVNVNATIETVRDPEKICPFGKLTIPVLMIDNHIVCQGKVPTVSIIKNLIIQRN
jgi:hypothetical protein